MKIDTVIGIDPGANGGIAVWSAGYNTKVIKMPKDVRDLRDVLAYYADNFKPIVFLEKLSVRPDDVMVEGDKAAMGKLYRIQRMMANYEHLKALIETAGIPYVMVHPMTWQTKLSLRIKNEDKPERKRRYREIAAKTYTNIKVSLWNADALLILHFGRWALNNEPNWVKANLPEREYQKLF